MKKFIFIGLCLFLFACEDKAKLAIERERVKLERLKFEEQKRKDQELREEKKRIEEQKRVRREKAEKRKRDEQYVKQVVEEKKEWVISRYNGGQDVIADVRDWEYNDVADTYKAEIKVEWNGKAVRINSYYVYGDFFISKANVYGNREVSFTPTLTSSSLDEFEGARFLIKALQSE